MKNNLKLNAGTGMALGTLVGAAIALLVLTLSGDSTIWNWALPVGLAVGLAIGAGQSSGKEKEDMS